MNATIQDVAAHARVSVSTVSRAFNNPNLVSKKTRQRVLDAAKDLNFSIMRSATVLKSGQSLRIALLISDPISSWFNASILEGLNSVFTQAGYDIAIRHIHTLSERREFFEDLPIRRNADAVIVASFDIAKTEIERLQTISVPLVGINSSLIELFDATVNIDDEQGGILLAQHLLYLGHRNIAFVASQTDDSMLNFSAQQRVNSFAAVCRTRGIEHTIIRVSKEHSQAEDALAQILCLKRIPTAIACQEDRIALPLLFQLEKSGMQVPGKISVTGFDDGPFANAIGLTTIRQKPVELGKMAALKTLDLIRGNQIDDPHETIPARLILRNSTSRISDET